MATDIVDNPFELLSTRPTVVAYIRSTIGDDLRMTKAGAATVAYLLSNLGYIQGIKQTASVIFCTDAVYSFFYQDLISPK